MSRKKFSALKATGLILSLYVGFWILIGFLQKARTVSVSSILLDDALNGLVILLLVVIIKKGYQITFAEMALTCPNVGTNVWLGLLMGGLLWMGAGVLSDTTEHIVPPWLMVPMKYDFLAIYAGSRGVSRAILFFVFGFTTPLIEEIFFRALIHSVLRRGFSPLATLILSSGIFGLWHVYPSLVVATFLIGCGLTWLREYGKSLLGPIVAHTTINCLSLIFSEPM